MCIQLECVSNKKNYWNLLSFIIKQNIGATKTDKEFTTQKGAK